MFVTTCNHQSTNLFLGCSPALPTLPPSCQPLLKMASGREQSARPVVKPKLPPTWSTGRGSGVIQYGFNMGKSWENHGKIHYKWRFWKDNPSIDGRFCSHVWLHEGRRIPRITSQWPNGSAHGHGEQVTVMCLWISASQTSSAWVSRLGNYPKTAWFKMVASRFIAINWCVTHWQLTKS